jgi:leader peptidase (prepilin peptidase)/N-methyltransferase
MYPAVELLTGLLFVACFLVFGLSFETFKWLFFLGLIVILIITDVRIRILPDEINWFGFGLGLAFAIRVAPTDATCMRLTDHFPPFLQRSAVLGVSCALLGALAGSMLLLGAAALYKLARGREGMGMGDVKMMLLIGSFLGIQGTFLTLLFGTLLGSIVGLLLVLALFFGGWRSNVAARAHRRGLGSVPALRWTISSRYQLPLGTFLGIAALLVVFFGRSIDLFAYRFLR